MRSPARCLKKKLANTSDNHRRKMNNAKVREKKGELEKAISMAEGAQPTNQVASHGGHVGYGDRSQMQPDENSNQADSGDSKGKRKAGHDDEDAASSVEPAKKKARGVGAGPSISNVSAGNVVHGSSPSMLAAAGSMYGNADPGYTHSPYAPTGPMQPFFLPSVGAPAHPQTSGPDAMISGPWSTAQTSPAVAETSPPQGIAPQAQLQQHGNGSSGEGYFGDYSSAAANGSEDAAQGQSESPAYLSEESIRNLREFIDTPSSGATGGETLESGELSTAAFQSPNGYAGADALGMGPQGMGVVAEGERGTEVAYEDDSPQRSSAEATNGSGSSLNSAAVDPFGEYFDFSGLSEYET